MGPLVYRRSKLLRTQKSPVADNGGFTIVELLIVIVVIGILAAITTSVFNGVQKRARDSQRAQDISAIKKSLLLYNSAHGGVQRTYSYAGNGTGGWNYSAGSNWLSFLEDEYGEMPVDPLNLGASSSAADSSYRYFCYNAGTSGYTDPTVVLGHWSESTSTLVTNRFVVDSCI